MPKHYDLSESSADLETLARQVQGLANVERKKQRQKLLATHPEAAQPKWLRNPLTKALFFGAMISFAVIVGVFAFAHLSQESTQHIVVPDVLGQDYQSAKSALTQLGLKVTIKQVPTDDKAPDTVVATLPVAGTKLTPATEVTLSVSVKNEHATKPEKPNATSDTPPPSTPDPEAANAKQKLPDVEGMIDEKATSTLNKMKLALNITVTQTHDAAQPDRLVLACDPKPGTTVAEGAAVHLVVNSLATSVTVAEPSGDGLVQIPDYAGCGNIDTVKDLERLGFATATTTEKSHLQSTGYVIKTDPSAGSKLPKGSTVKVIIAVD